MDFISRKLSKDQVSNLSQVSVGEIYPYTLMHMPTYIWMQKNEKFIALKRPMDFFTEQELSKLRPQEKLFILKTPEGCSDYRKSAESIRSILMEPAKTISPRSRKIELSREPFELSREVLKKMGPLWNEYDEGVLGLEPFLVAIFVDVLCDPISMDLLTDVREKSVDLYERNIYRSSWSVFLALMIGYTNLDFLNRLRVQSFGRLEPIAYEDAIIESECIESLASITVNEATQKVLLSDLSDRPENVIEKIMSRAKKMSENYVIHNRPPPTVFGKGGIFAA